MSATDKSKLDGITAGATAYVHPAGDGNLHVPATGTGSSGKVLKAGATAGSAAWGTLSASDVTGLGGAALLNVGTVAGTVAAGDHTHPGSAPAAFGRWTPELVFALGSGTFTIRRMVGRYVRVGVIMHAWFEIEIGSSTLLGGRTFIRLPEPSRSFDDPFYAMHILPLTHFSGITLPTGYSSISMVISRAANSLELYCSGTNKQTIFLPGDALTSNSALAGHLCYETD